VDLPDVHTDPSTWPPPPAAVEYEIVATNVSEAALTDVVVLDHYFLGITPVSTTPPAGIDAAARLIRWELGTLAPGEERRLRATFAAEDQCSEVGHDVVATALSGEGTETYGHLLDNWAVVGTSWEGCHIFVDDIDDGVGVDPAPTPTQIATAEPPSGGSDVSGRVTPTVEQDAQVSNQGGEWPSSSTESSALTSGPAPEVAALPQTGAGAPEEGAARSWAALLVGAMALGALGAARLRRRSKTSPR
jgi:hypothetical protein